MRIFAFGFLLITAPCMSAVFGDANAENGIEDLRQTRVEAPFWPKEFRSVGRLICDGLVQGSAILIDRGNDIPQVITAGHVLKGYKFADCVYAPESDAWGRHLITGVAASGEVRTFGPKRQQYESDWIILELQPWSGWQSLAVELTAGLDLAPDEFTGYLVGYDVVRGLMTAHLDCRFGISDLSPLISGSAELLWDACDTAGGASGGALFVKTSEGLKLVGMRVGSLYNQSHFEGVPEMGERFGLNSYINVSRKLVGWDN